MTRPIAHPIEVVVVQTSAAGSRRVVPRTHTGDAGTTPTWWIDPECDAFEWTDDALAPRRRSDFPAPTYPELGDLITARLSPKGYEEVSRVNILTPTNTMAPPAGRKVIWMHPAFANRCVYARNDRELVCVSMDEKDYR